MKAKDALVICRNINSDKYTDAEKLEAVRELWKYVSKDLTKPKMVHIIAFLLKIIDDQAIVTVTMNGNNNMFVDNVGEMTINM